MAIEPVQLAENLYFFGTPEYGILYDHETIHVFHGSFSDGWLRGQVLTNLKTAEGLFKKINRHKGGFLLIQGNTQMSQKDNFDKTMDFEFKQFGKRRIFMQYSGEFGYKQNITLGQDGLQTEKVRSVKEQILDNSL